METRKPKTPGPAKEYTERVSLYETPEGVDLLEQLCGLLRMKQAPLLRHLIREEAKRRGVQPE